MSTLKNVYKCYTLVIWKSTKFQVKVVTRPEDMTPQEGTIISVLVLFFLEKPSMDPELVCMVSSASFRAKVKESKGV